MFLSSSDGWVSEVLQGRQTTGSLAVKSTQHIEQVAFLECSVTLILLPSELVSFARCSLSQRSEL